MKISGDTKISALIKANPASIVAIASINKHFEKLRNPILRKILAPRVTIADAAKLGGCKVEDFFFKLKELGFELENVSLKTSDSVKKNNSVPAFMNEVQDSNITTLDVRDDLASGKDPFQRIMGVLTQMPKDNMLLIINSFEPVPLINILKKKGFEHYTQVKPDGIIYTYLKQTQGNKKNTFENIEKPLPNDNKKFDETVKKFEGKIKEIDVRNLEMPMPMVMILQDIEILPVGMALFVHHKKVPQYLLPELKERGFSWLIKEIKEGDVRLLIYR